MIPLGNIDAALRERLEMAGCYPVRALPEDGSHGALGDGAEVWFTPHLNREFVLEGRVPNAAAANAALRRAGMEEAF